MISLPTLRKSSKKQYEKYELDIKQFEKGSKIGSGVFGKVYRVEEKSTGKQYAAKYIDCRNDEIMRDRTIDREVKIMIKARHPTIISIIGYSIYNFSGENNVIIIMELVTNGSLGDLLKKIRKPIVIHDYDDTCKQIILAGIARGMKYLHDHNIMHRDLKPDNVLLDSNYHPKITDFGLSKSFENGHSNEQSRYCGTPIYSAPETFRTETCYNRKADVYSFGILMYEVVTDQLPYPEFENNKITGFAFMKMIIEGKRPLFTSSIKESIKQLIERCWSDKPEERPSFTQIFESLTNFCSRKNMITDDDCCLDNVDIDDFCSYVEDISDFNENINTSTNQLKTENEQLKKEIENLKLQLAKSTSNNKKQEKQMKLLKNENEELKSQLNKLKTNNEKYKNQIKQLKEENNNLRTQIKESATKNINNESQIERQTIKQFNSLTLIQKISRHHSKKHDICFILDATISMQRIFDEIIDIINDYAIDLKTSNCKVDYIFSSVIMRDPIDYTETEKIPIEQCYQKAIDDFIAIKKQQSKEKMITEGIWDDEIEIRREMRKTQYDTKKYPINKNVPIRFSASIEYLISELLKVECGGGNDDPEDWAGSLLCAIKDLDWRDNSRKTIIIISDSNAHGKKFCGYDNHNEEESILTHLIQQLAYNQYEININNVFVDKDRHKDKDDGCQKTIQTFRDIYLNSSGIHMSQDYLIFKSSSGIYWPYEIFENEYGYLEEPYYEYDKTLKELSIFDECEI